MKYSFDGKHNNSTTPYDGFPIILPVSGGRQVCHLYNSRGSSYTSNYGVTVTTSNHHPPFRHPRESSSSRQYLQRKELKILPYNLLSHLVVGFCTLNVIMCGISWVHRLAGVSHVPLCINPDTVV